MTRSSWFTVIAIATALAVGPSLALCGEAAGPVPGAPTLPAGHPPLPGGPSSGEAAMPPGHPPLPGAPSSGGMAMPPGHPPLPGGPLPMAPDAKGTLVVQAVQGTRGGPAIAGDPVVVELYNSEGQSVRKIEGKLDDRGQVVLENLAVGGGVRPEVVVRHAGVEYRQIGDFMHASPPDQRMMLVLYEASEEAPPWVIRARHLFVKRSEEGFYVKDMMVVESPTDKVWTGKPDAKGRRSTLELPLTPNTGRFDFYAGFEPNGTDLNEGRLINRTALFPGVSQFQIGYVVPVVGGKATIEIHCPADTNQVVLILPDDGSKATVTGLSEGTPMEMGPQKVRMYSAQDVKAGQKVSVALSGLAQTPPATRPAPPPPAKAEGHTLPQTVAVVGGGAVLAAGLTLICLKRPKALARTQ